MTFVDNTSLPGSPVFDYGSRDYPSIYADTVSRRPLFLPQWTSISPADFGLVLLQEFAYVGDILNYYLDRLASEAFIQTATQSVSIINLAAMLDYTPTLAVGASVVLQITVGSGVVGPVVIPAGTQFQTQATGSQAPIIFTTTQALTIPANSSATPQFVGTVLAVQGVQVSGEAVSISDGSVNQTYPLLFNPVSDGSDDVLVDIGLGPQSWTEVENLIDYGPTDQVYTTFVDANDVFYVVFGDGVNGLVPPLGSPITANYMTTSGSLGNVGAGTITQPVGAIVGVTQVTNLLSASGGADPESLSLVQVNAPASLKTLNRAITANDFAVLAEQVAGVQWASAVMLTYQLVNLYIAPVGGGIPTTALQNAVLAYLQGPPVLILGGTTVTPQSPTYVPVNISANVVIQPNFGDVTMQTAVINALTDLLALTNTGFGVRVTLGLLYSVIQALTGVEYAAITSLNRQMLCTLTSGLTNGSPVTTIAVSPLPQAIFTGDTLKLTDTTGAHTQTVTASSGAVAGATTISAAFTPNFSYQINSTVQDTTGVNDAVMLPNEIPVVGTLAITVTGGVVGE